MLHVPPLLRGVRGDLDFDTNKRYGRFYVKLTLMGSWSVLQVSGAINRIRSDYIIFFHGRDTAMPYPYKYQVQLTGFAPII